MRFAIGPVHFATRQAGFVVFICDLLADDAVKCIEPYESTVSAWIGQSMEDARRLSGTSGLATAVLLSQYQTPGAIRLS